MKLQSLETFLVAASLASAAKPNCRTKHFNATFDDLPAGTDIPDGYAGLRYTNWVRGSGDLISPGKEYIEAIDSNTGYLTADPKKYEDTIMFTLHSFYLGCTTDVGFGPIPTDCTVTVTTKTFSPLYNIAQHNYTYEVKGQGKREFRMHKIDAGDIAGSAMYWGLAAGMGSPNLYIDSLEMSQVHCK